MRGTIFDGVAESILPLVSGDSDLGSNTKWWRRGYFSAVTLTTAPVSSTDATNKAYVDAQVGGALIVRTVDNSVVLTGISTVQFDQAVGFVLTNPSAGVARVSLTGIGTGTVTNSGTLTANAVILGNGTTSVKALGSLGTTTTLLHGNASGAPTFAGVSIADHTATGTPDASTFLRGDNTWATPAGSGTVTTTGSPANGNLTQFSGATSITNGNLSGDVTTSNTLAATITNAAVTNAKLAAVTAPVFKGRVTSGSGNVEDLTVTQATAMLNLFSSTLQGLAPLSGGGTTNFLRADGTWAAPSGSGTGTVTNTGTLTANQMLIGNGGVDIKVLPGTVGGIPFFATGPIVQSTLLLTNHAVMIGGGSAAAPKTIGVGTTTTLLHGSASGDPSFSAVDLVNDVTGNLPVSNIVSATNRDASHFLRGDGTWATAPGGVTGSAATGNDTYWSSASAVAGETTILHAAAFGLATGATGATNRAAIQSALTALPSGGGKIVLPAGAFALDSTAITVTKPVTFEGTHTANNLGTILSTAGASNDVFSVNTVSQVVFKDFSLTASVTRTGGAYIHFVTTNNFGSLISNMTLAGHLTGLNMAAAQGWRVRDCYFVGRNTSAMIDILGQSTVSDNGGFVIDGNVFDNGGTNGTAIQINSGGGIGILRNAFLNHGACVIIDWLASTSSSSEVMINNNVFDGQSGGSYGLILSAESGSGTLSLINIVGNSFAAHSVAEIATGGSAPNNLTNVVVSGNTFQVSNGAIGIDSHITTLHVSGNSFIGGGSSATGVVLQSDSVNNTAWGNAFNGTFGTSAGSSSATGRVGFTGTNLGLTYEQGILLA